MSQSKKGLGKTFKDIGISSLLGEGAALLDDSSSARDNESKLGLSDSTKRIDSQYYTDIADLVPCSFQPRQTFDEASIQSLANSIKQQGILQPLVVRERKMASGYEIIAGERRWRAAQAAGLAEVPIIVKDLDDKQVMAVSLIENIQREDLNALDQAEAMEKLLSNYEMTHQELADCLGYSRVAVSNYLRLNKLEFEVKSLLREDKIDMGHARALLVLTGYEQAKAAQHVVDNALSVRATEKWLHDRQRFSDMGSVAAVVPYEMRMHEKKLAVSLNRKVVIKQGKGHKGRIILSYDGQDDLENLLNELCQTPVSQ